MSSFQPKGKIVLVIDHRGLAFDNVATALQARLPVTRICWNDYRSIGRIIEVLALERPKIIHFFWRDHLRLFLEELLRKNRLVEFRDTHFTFSVPDHLRQDPTSLAQFEILPMRATSYVVTNRLLEKSYQDMGLLGSPWGVIHDFSENSRINETMEKDFSGKLRALWVGNSKWGQTLGAPDHKGLAEVIRGAFDDDFEVRYSIELIVCDSSRHKYSKEELRQLYKSSHLILQASVSEGTGLPLLEGMAHGCVPLTTEVGVVSELFSKELRTFCLATRNPIQFREKLINLIGDRKRMVMLSVESQQSVYSFYSDSPENKWFEFFSYVLASEVPDQLSIKSNSESFIRENRLSLRRFPFVLQSIRRISRR